MPAPTTLAAKPTAAAAATSTAAQSKQQPAVAPENARPGMKRPLDHDYINNEGEDGITLDEAEVIEQQERLRRQKKPKVEATPALTVLDKARMRIVKAFGKHIKDEACALPRRFCPVHRGVVPHLTLPFSAILTPRLCWHQTQCGSVASDMLTTVLVCHSTPQALTAAVEEAIYNESRKSMASVPPMVLWAGVCGVGGCV